MKSTLFLTLLITAVACGPRRPGRLGHDGKIGQDGQSMGIDMQDSGDVCPSGGVILSSFADNNRNSFLDSSEAIYSVKTLCNGINGTNGVDGVNGSNGTNSSVSLESLPSGAACPSGGILISSNTGTAQVVCNGVNGLNGAQGIQGVQGLPGIQGPAGPQGPQGIHGNNGTNGSNGTNGTSVVPVKFCSSSSASFPEYGLKVGNDVFAVYWTGAQAFLAKLNPGSYQTTTGTQDCNFTI